MYCCMNIVKSRLKYIYSLAAPRVLICYVCMYIITLCSVYLIYYVSCMNFVKSSRYYVYFLAGSRFVVRGSLGPADLCT